MKTRVTNIHVAADLLNNTIVEPGATFSLNDTIGPRTVDRGFVLAPVFYGEFTEDIGGGVSQLATTTFNAVFWGGYEDVFHKPHTIYISRYPMGREATVNYGTVDLQFRNDSNAGVLIRTSYSSNSITVTFYGDKEGKVVTEEGRKVLAERPVEQQPFECPGPPGLDKNNVCAGLPQGQQKLVEEGHAGLDVEFFRVITRPGQEPVRERFFWRYRMTPNKFLVGTAPPTHDDAGAPAHGNHRGTAGGDDGSAAARNDAGSAGHRGRSRALARTRPGRSEPPFPSTAPLARPIEHLSLGSGVGAGHDEGNVDVATRDLATRSINRVIVAAIAACAAAFAVVTPASALASDPNPRFAVSAPVVGVSATPTGNGFWQVARRRRRVRQRRRHVLRIGRRGTAQPTDRRHGPDPDRPRLLARRIRRRHLRLRRRACSTARPAGCGSISRSSAWPRLRRAGATGSSHPTAASSASATPPSTAPPAASD